VTGQSHLLRRLVCGNCGATAPLSDRPYQQCASCSTVSDYDFGVARQHHDWPAHEARLAELFVAHKDAFEAAVASGDQKRYALAYAEVLRTLIAEFPALYPTRCSDESYRERLVQFHAAWQATSLDREIVEGNMLFGYLRGKVVPTRPKTLWSLIDHALKIFDVQQRLVDAIPPGPPEDFAPKYVRRFTISNTVAEWLPQLAPKAQRELVTRMGVSNEYLDSTQNVVTCPSCGGSVPVDEGFLEIACRYCGAKIQEARAEFRAVEAERAAYAAKKT
jgi:DNA-directed RNA polymerase subunit RPC12/RpoP